MYKKSELKKSNIDKYLKKYGNHFLSYSTKQINMSYFYLEKIGYIAYKHVSVPFALEKRVVVLGNPICASQNYELIIRKFLDDFNCISFLMCDSSIVQILKKYNHYINEWGYEHYLYLKHFELKGKKRKLLRRWYNKFNNNKYTVEEFQFDPNNKKDYEDISNEWLSTKNSKENSFANRPLEYKNNPDIRKFHIKRGIHIVGFIIFDPIYMNENIIGYYQNIVRYKNTCESGLMSYGIIKAIEKFIKEQVIYISLGVAPGKDINYGDFESNIWLHRCLNFLYKYCNFIYPAKGIYFNKKIFNFNIKKTYYTSQKKDIREFGVIYNSCKK